MLKRRKKAVGDEKPNQKVKNATKVIIDGITFRSKLEGVMYGELKRLNIPFDYEKEKFILQEKFRFRGEAIREITLLPDFTGDRFILECKVSRHS